MDWQNSLGTWCPEVSRSRADTESVSVAGKALNNQYLEYVALRMYFKK